MYTALYRACRPETFDEILGQEHIVKILKNQVKADSVSHAYLFCGTRGTGKTTTARILAKAVNCLSEGDRPCGVCDHCRAIKEGNFIDVIEIDAASNNGVENIRELRESVKYPPAAGRKKVYIIDEVHMLSTGAFNALLKTLEEPPEHVMFILATTEPQKLPATILSRCMRLDFRRVSQNIIADNMTEICSSRGVELMPDAARLLAGCADGSVRDGLSILDQVLAGGDRVIDRDKVLEYVGTTGEEFFIDLTELVSLRKSAEALVLLDRVLQEGKDVKQIMKDWVSHYRSLLITKFIKNPADMLNMSVENIKRIEEQSRKITFDEIDFAIMRLSTTINNARWSTNPRVLLELAIVAISEGPDRKERPAPKKSAAPSESPSAGYQPDTASEHKLISPKPEKKEEGASNLTPQGNKLHQTDGDPQFQEIWEDIFRSGPGSAGSFNLIRSGTEAVHMGSDSFTITANSDFTRRFTEQKRQELEAMVSQRAGRQLRMICELKGKETADTSGAEGDAEEIAKEAEKLLGITVDIE